MLSTTAVQTTGPDANLADHDIDAHHVAPSGLAQLMGHIGNDDYPDAQGAIDDAIARIIAAGWIAGATVHAGNVSRFQDQGVNCFYTNVNDWIESGGGSFSTLWAGKWTYGRDGAGR